MKTQQEIELGLRQFYGSESFHRMSNKHIITEGVKWLCDNAECYWLVDAIISYHGTCMQDGYLQDFQFWTLNVDLQNKTATLICERDTDDVAIKQEIEYTSFPLPTIKLYCAPSGDGKNYTILLPSEY